MNPNFIGSLPRRRPERRLRTLTRQCLKCGRQQVVAKEKMKVEVPCEQCGAPVPKGMN